MNTDIVGSITARVVQGLGKETWPNLTAEESALWDAIAAEVDAEPEVYWEMLPVDPDLPSWIGEGGDVETPLVAADFHYKGKHDQKTHAGGRGIDPYLLSATVEEDEFGNMVATWTHPETGAVGRAFGEDIDKDGWTEREIDALKATAAAYGRNNPTPWQGANGQVVFHNEETADRWYDKESKGAITETPADTEGWTHSRAPSSEFHLMPDRIREGPRTGYMDMGGMAGAEQVEAIVWDAIHEAGHVHAKQWTKSAPFLMDEMFASTQLPQFYRPSNSSEYAKTSAHEMYAELFAEWTVSGGNPIDWVYSEESGQPQRNGLAHAYAEAFGWQ